MRMAAVVLAAAAGGAAGILDSLTWADGWAAAFMRAAA